MICWLKTFALELGVILSLAAFVAAVLGIISGLAIVAERTPRIVDTSLKWMVLSTIILGSCLFAGVMTWKAHEKVCAVGLKATWASVWKPNPR